MRYKIPNIPTFTGLKGIDKRIQEMQTGLADLSWVQYSFGLCDRIVVKDGEDDAVIPACRVNNTTDPIDMRPWLDDAHNSYCFWDMTDPAVPVYGDNLVSNRFPSLSYDVSCIFVVNLDSISSDRKVARSTVRNNILTFFHQTIRVSGIFEIVEMCERDIETIYEGYDIKDPLLFLKEQYAAFRVDGTITFKQDCNV